MGEQSYRSLDELPESPELVVITVRAGAFATAVDDALRVGARAIVAITAGLGEGDDAGRAIQDEAVARCREAGTVLVGPNCLGIADSTTNLDLTWDDFGPGPVALISQSGNIGLELAQHAHHAAIGFTRFVSLGNQADLDAAECIEDLVTHEATRVIAVYVEDFGDGRHFARVAAEAARAGKPVILLTVGGTDASTRTAHSHTGALVSDSLAIDAACAASGMYRVNTPLQMIDLAQVLLMPDLLPGRRFGIVGDGGGHVALAADRLVAQDLRVEPVGPLLAAKLAEGLPPTATTTNPVDIAGGGEEDVWNFERAVRGLMESGEVDAVLLTGYFGGYSEQIEPYAKLEVEVAESMAAAARATHRSLVVQTMFPRSPTSLTLRKLGVPVFSDIEAATSALGRSVNSPPLFKGWPGVGKSEETVTRALRRRMLGSRTIPELPKPALHRAPKAVPTDYFGVRGLLQDAGIAFAEARLVKTEREAIDAAAAIGYPVVLKALGHTHKSDAGGVRLAIANEAMLLESFRAMKSHLQPSLWSVEREAPIELGVELLVGVKRDRSFGPIALAGLGGVYAEVFRDVSVALAPVTASQAVGLVESLRGSQLLTRWRMHTSPAFDIQAAAEALSKLSSLAADLPEIQEVEINPLLVLEHGVLALDARLTRAD